MEGTIDSVAGRPLSESEKAAATAVASALGGKLRPRDVDGAPEGTHDFDIHLSAGKRIALEVTTAADAMVISQRAAAFSTQWGSPRLKHNWWVSVRGSESTQSRSVAHLGRQAIPVLERLEQSGWVHHDARYAPADAARSQQQAAADLRVAGIAAVHRLGKPERGHLANVLLSFRRGVVSDPQAINALVTERAQAKVEKLLAADADERHLFVWVDSSRAEAELAMATLPAPHEPPSIPAGIDVVWVAIPGSGQVQALWRAAPHTPWEIVHRGEQSGR